MLSPPEVIDWDCKPIELPQSFAQSQSYATWPKGDQSARIAPKGLVWNYLHDLVGCDTNTTIPVGTWDTWDMGYTANKYNVA